MAYITQSDLEDRLSAETVKQIFDDDNSGAADADPIAAYIRDAEALVNGYLHGNYPMPLPSVPDLVKSMTLDLAHAAAHRRHPEYVRALGKEVLELVMANLKAIRKGEIRLDVATPVPENVIGTLDVGTTDETPDGVGTGIFKDGFGDY